MRLILSILLLLVGWVLITTTSFAHAQDDEEKEYVGEGECNDCHVGLSRAHSDTPHGLTLQEAEDEDEDERIILANFDSGEDLRTVNFPGENEARPFTREDILLAIGAGRHIQAYVYQVEENQYAVFPAQWDVVNEQWLSYELGESWPDDPAYDFVQNCAGCHVTGLEVDEEGADWEDEAVQCEACHGPGSVHVDTVDESALVPSESELEAIRSAIVVSPSAQVCGQCHSQGTEPSNDGPYPVDYLPGGDLLAEDVFSLVPQDSDAHWWTTGHAKDTNMQFNEWVSSRHADSLQSVLESDSQEDSCLACHSTDYTWIQEVIQAHEEEERDGDPPDPVTLDSAQYGVTCIGCHDVHADPEEAIEGSLRDEPYTLCTTCHTDSELDNHIHYPEQQMFEGVQFLEEVDAAPSGHFVSDQGPDCATCHMSNTPVGAFEAPSHTMQVISPGEAAEIEALQDTCSACHGEQAQPESLQTLIDDVQNNTQSRLEAIHENMNGDAPTWVAQAVRFVEQDRSRGIHNYAYTNTLLRTIEGELELTQAADITLEDLVQDMPRPEVASTVEDEDEDLVDEDVGGVSVVSIIIMVLSVLIVLAATWRFFSEGYRV